MRSDRRIERFIRTIALTIWLATLNTEESLAQRVFGGAEFRPIGKKYVGRWYKMPDLPDGYPVKSGWVIRGLSNKSFLLCDSGQKALLNHKQEQTIPQACAVPPGRTDPSEIRLGGDNNGIPYIISPRYTLLLSNRPKLRWNSLRGKKSSGITYHVKILPSSVQEATPLCDKSYTPNTPPKSFLSVFYEEMEYPCSEALEVDKNYKLVIEANGISSEDERKYTESLSEYPSIPKSDVRPSKPAGLFFKVFDNQMAEGVQSNLKGKTELEAVVIYAETYLLYDDAIEILRNLIKKQNSKSPNLSAYRVLGNLYARVGLTSLAESAYNEALQLSPQTSLEKALIQKDLGNLYFKKGLLKEAKSLLENSKIFLEEEYQPIADQIQEIIDRIEKN